MMPDGLAAHEATFGRKINVTMPSDLAAGRFSEWLRLEVRPTGDEADTTTLDIPVLGEVVGRLAVYGSAVNSQGVVDMGVQAAGVGTSRRLLIKVRDEQRHLVVKRVATQPDFIRAHVEPTASRSEELGLYELHIEIPPAAPACTYLGLALGSLRIEFDHPRISPLELKLRFAVGG
jgi:hypothetical protein